MDDKNTHLRFPSKYHQSLAPSINDFIIGALLYYLSDGILDFANHTILDDLNTDLIVYVLEQSVTNDKFRKYTAVSKSILDIAFRLNNDAPITNPEVDDDAPIPNPYVDARHRQFVTILYQLYLEAFIDHPLDKIIEDYIVIWLEKKVAKSAGKT